MIRKLSIVATNADHGRRLDHTLLTRCPTSTRRLVHDAIGEGQIRVNDGPAAKGTTVCRGDRIEIRELAERVDVRVLPNPALALSVLYEDTHLLALDKPPGMPVHPLSPRETGTLANALLAYDPGLADVGGEPLFPALAHRLDTDTSGVVLAARANDVHTRLRTAFRERRVDKRYVALVHGTPPDDGTLEHALAHDPRRPGHMLVFGERRPPGVMRPMRAVTAFTVRARLGVFALLDVRIRTGVTHQIRAQLAAAGHPITGDGRYGNPASGAPPAGLARQFLHAASVELAHPVTGDPLRVEAPLPADLTTVLAALGWAEGTGAG